MLEKIWSRLREYVSNPDAMAKAVGTVAVVVAGNQFYPLYLHAIAGIAAGRSRRFFSDLRSELLRRSFS
jgi:hypothetical protein